MGDFKLRIKSKSLAASLFVGSLVGIAAPASFGAPASAPSCLQSVGSWVNSPLPRTESHNFRIAYDATPLNSRRDGVSGSSSGPAAGYTSLAAALRFNTGGTIDARNGGSFTAASSIRFVAGTTYHVILDINGATHTYNAYVVAGGVQRTLGTNLAFRTEQSGVATLRDVDALTVTGSQTLCNINVTNDAVVPSITTQPGNSSVTAGQAATFSLAASGTATLTYQWSKNGAPDAVVDAHGQSFAVIQWQATFVGVLDFYRVRLVLTLTVLMVLLIKRFIPVSGPGGQ
jgi:hypothetical protein